MPSSRRGARERSRDRHRGIGQPGANQCGDREDLIAPGQDCTRLTYAAALLAKRVKQFTPAGAHGAVT
jgi:hypothetical protein